MTTKNQEDALRPPALALWSALVFIPLFLGAIDNWQHSEQDLPSRSEAIRRLVDQALGAKEGSARSWHVPGAKRVHPVIVGF